MIQDSMGLTLEDNLQTTLTKLAPGTELRDALDRIIRGRTGALIVMGFNPVVADMCSGGFVLEAPFSATRLRELAKMDGAVVLNPQTGLIVRAGVQLLPDPAISTSESGTRHRTAERVAKQTGFPVIAVSQSMNMVALYLGDRRHVLEEPEDLSSRTKQALATLERYRARLDEVSAVLSSVEVEDVVTVRDVVAVAGRQEMVWRIGEEISALLAELGVQGRLLRLQFDELISGVDEARRLLIRDYLKSNSGLSIEQVLANLANVSVADLLEVGVVAQVLGLANSGVEADDSVAPRGYRLLSRVSRISPPIADRIAQEFGSLQHILAASLDDLMKVEGVGELRARAVREGLSRIAESSMLDRYV